MPTDCGDGKCRLWRRCVELGATELDPHTHTHTHRWQHPDVQIFMSAVVRAILRNHACADALTHSCAKQMPCSARNSLAKLAATCPRMASLLQIAQATTAARRNQFASMASCNGCALMPKCSTLRPDRGTGTRNKCSADWIIHFAGAFATRARRRATSDRAHPLHITCRKPSACHRMLRTASRPISLVGSLLTPSGRDTSPTRAVSSWRPPLFSGRGPAEVAP